MSVLCSISVTLLLIAICHSYGGISQKGCAYHVPENGETFGRCDLDNSFCSYGCQVGITSSIHHNFVIVRGFQLKVWSKSSMYDWEAKIVLFKR